MLSVCVWAADGEVLNYYQQGIAVVMATLLFDCLPPDARPPGVALHFRISATAFCVFLCLSSASFPLKFFMSRRTHNNRWRNVERANILSRKYCK